MSDAQREATVATAEQPAFGGCDPQVAKAMRASPNMPRQLRAKLGMTDEELPEGKQLVAGPSDKGLAKLKEADAHEGGALSKAKQMHLLDKGERIDKINEIEKMHNPERGSSKFGAMPDHFRQTTPPGQKLYQKTMISKSNQLMDSRHRTGDTIDNIAHTGGKRQGGSRLPANQ